MPGRDDTNLSSQGPGQDKGSETGNGDDQKNPKEIHKSSFGKPGKCLCPNCSYKWPRQPGKPCYGIICPQCGSKMMRE